MKLKAVYQNEELSIVIVDDCNEVSVVIYDVDTISSGHKEITIDLDAIIDTDSILGLYEGEE